MAKETPFRITRYGIVGNLTGSVEGTASFAIQGLTASYALSASHAITASYVKSADTASYNPIVAASASIWAQDTKVTAVDKHYTPTQTTAKSAAEGQVIVGIGLDAAGHVTSVTGSTTAGTASHALEAESASYVPFTAFTQSDVYLTASVGGTTRTVQIISASRATNANAATSATKLKGTSGSLSVPVYISGGVPKAVSSINLTGSIAGTGITASAGFLGDLTGTASQAISTSYAATAATASYNADAKTALAWIASSGSNAHTHSNGDFLDSVESKFLPITGGTVTGDVSVTNNFTVGGNLYVNGTSSIVNTQDLVVKDKLILVASGTATQGVADGAGIAIQTASATTIAGAEAASARFQYRSSDNKFTASVGIVAPSFTGSLQGTASYATSASRAISAASADTASYVKVAQTASYYGGSVTSASYADNASKLNGQAASYYATATATSNAQATASNALAQITASGSVWAANDSTSLAGHYTPVEATDSKLSATASGATAAWNIDVVKAVGIKRDAKGHVVGLDVLSGKIPSAPTSVTSASYAANATSASYATNAGTANTASYNAEAAALRTIITNNSSSWATDTKVTSVDNHYKATNQISGSQGGATKVVTGVTLDAAGHVTAVSTANSNSLKVTSASYADNANSASYAATASYVSNPPIETIYDTRTSGTSSVYTGVSTDSEIYDGKVIVFIMGHDNDASSSANQVSLNLTLAGGSTTGALPVFYKNDVRLTTHYSEGDAIFMVYDGNVDGWRCQANYNTDGKVISAKAHYVPEMSGTSGSTAARMFVKTIDVDSRGHITGVTPGSESYDTRLYEDSTNPIENHAVYDQFMTEADVRDLMEEIDPDYFNNSYFTIEAITSGSITRGDLNSIEVYYSLNNGEWTLFAEGDQLDVDAGDIIKFAGEPNNNIPGGEQTGAIAGEDSLFSSITCAYSVYGNIASLLIGNDFTEIGNNLELFNDSYYYGYGLLNYNSEFVGMFANTPVVDASHLVLYPGYLPNYIYAAMFMNCTSLVRAPKLPSIYLAPYCYADMFAGCTSLTTAPTLPATDLPEGCYFEMFSGSSVLNYVECSGIPESSGDGGDGGEDERGTRGLGDEASGSTDNWLAGVAEVGTFVKNPAATWETGPSGIPVSWSVQIADSTYVPIPTEFSNFTEMTIGVEEEEMELHSVGDGSGLRGGTRGTVINSYSVFIASASTTPSARAFLSPDIHMDLTGSYEYDDGGGTVAKGIVTEPFTDTLSFMGSGSIGDTPDYVMNAIYGAMNVIDPNATIRCVAAFGGGNSVGDTTPVWIAAGSNGTQIYVMPGGLYFAGYGGSITSATILDGYYDGGGGPKSTEPKGETESR